MLQIKESDFDDGICEVDCGAYHRGYIEGDTSGMPRYYALAIRKAKDDKFEAYKRLHSEDREAIAFRGSLKEVVEWVNENYPEQAMELKR